MHGNFSAEYILIWHENEKNTLEIVTSFSRKFQTNFNEKMSFVDTTHD